MTDRAYERISLDTERSGSIPKQRSRITAFAGEDVVHYADESVSGSKIPFAQRPAGKQLLRELVKGDRVLVTKIDRAARNVRDLLDLVQTIEERGCSIVFVDQNIDTSGPIGKFILVLLAAIAELEADIIGERRRESLVAFAQEGRHAVGSAPYGFMSVDNPSGRGLVIRPDWRERENGDLPPAKLLRDAIDRVLAGEAQQQVLADLGLPLKKAGFSVLLRNPRLAGMAPDGDGVVTIEGVPRIDPEAALLSLTEWERLRKHMTRPEKKPWARQDGYGAAIHCATCGMRIYKSLGGKKRPNNNAYKCGRAKHQPGEPGASAMVHIADEHIEKVFLRDYGDMPYKVSYWRDDSSARTEALALAQITLQEAQKSFLTASGDEEEERAMRGLMAAKKAVREAEALPESRVQVVEDTGQTYADLWREAEDDAERVTLLKSVGVWMLQPGRAPIEERLTCTLPGTVSA